MHIVTLLAAALAPAAPDAPPAVSGVEIVARAPTAGDAQEGVVDYRPEFFTPVRPASALDMVQWLPGFSLEDTRDMRGLGGAVGNVLIDGKPPTSKTDTLASVLRRIPSAQVERVELIVGQAPGVDMRGYAVVANVILKKAAKPRREVTISSYLDGRGRAAPDVLLTSSTNTGGRLTEGSLEVGRQVFNQVDVGRGTWVRRDGTGAVLFAATSDALSSGIAAKATGAIERPVGGGTLRLNGSVFAQHYRWDEQDPSIASTDVYGLQQHLWTEQLELGLRWNRTLGVRTSLEVQGLQRLTWNDVPTASDRPPSTFLFHEHNVQRESVLRAVLRFARDPKLTLESSAEAALNGVVAQAGQLTDGVPTPLAAANLSVTETRIELGEAAIWKPSPLYSFTAGIKAETSGIASRRDIVLDRRLTYVKPRAVLDWAPDKATQVRLRVEYEASQIPLYSFTDIAEYNTGIVRAGNPHLRPQRDWVGEATFDRRFWNGGDLSLTLRRFALIDVADLVPIATPTGPATASGNIGSGSETNVVIAAVLPLQRLGLPGVMLKANATLIGSRVIDPATGRPRPLSYKSARSGEAHLVHDLPRWKTTWGIDLVYTGPFTLYRPTAVEGLSGAFVRTGVFVQRRFDSGMELRLELDNPIGAKVRQFVDVYDGLRPAAALSYADDRLSGIGQYVMLRVRRPLD